MAPLIGGSKTPGPAPKMPKASRRSVLIVDDEPDIVEALRMGLQDRLPTVEALGAHSGAEALALLRQRPVDLIVTDYKMPGMDGLAFLREVSAVRPGTPALMISAFPEPRLAQMATREYGVKMFIAKPFDLDYFIDIVRSRLFDHH